MPVASPPEATIRLPPSFMSWTLHAWPLLLWPVAACSPAAFRHLATSVCSGARSARVSGQTLWGGPLPGGNAGMAWDWVEVGRGIYAMADPMAVVTNLRIVGGEGGVLTAHEAARILNGIVHALPWQDEIERALQTPH